MGEWTTSADSRPFVYGPDRRIISCIHNGKPDRETAERVAAALNALLGVPAADTATEDET